MEPTVHPCPQVPVRAPRSPLPSLGPGPGPASSQGRAAARCHAGPGRHDASRVGRPGPDPARRIVLQCNHCMPFSSLYFIVIIVHPCTLVAWGGCSLYTIVIIVTIVFHGYRCTLLHIHCTCGVAHFIPLLPVYSTDHGYHCTLL